MNHALTLLAWNLCLSVPFALLAWCLCRVRYVQVRPALCHGIWLLVLLKLVTPPLISVPVLPALAGGSLAAPVSELSGPDEMRRSPVVEDQADIDVAVASQLGPAQRDTAEDAPPRVTAPRATRAQGGTSWHVVIVGLLTGSALVTLAMWLVALRQLHRVGRLLRSVPENPVRTSQLFHDVSRRFPFRVQPKLYVVDAAIAPMVWAEPGNPSVILSRQLADVLSDDQLRQVFAHELAHYARGDHWTNVFGFLVATLFWWHPVAWFARRELNLAAESCCDAIVLGQFSGSRQSYARTLLTVVDFVSAGQLLRPVLATTFGGPSSLRRRFQMLANSEVGSKVSSGGWWLLVAGAVTLVLLPARAQETQRPSQPKRAAASKNAPASDSKLVVEKTAADAKPAAKDGKYYVAGSVIDEDTKQPLAGATLRFHIQAEQDPNKRVRTASTDEQGHFRLEVPMGSIRLWFPELKPGYWLEPANAMTPVSTSADKPVATLDIAAKRGLAWPVRVTIEGGLPDKGQVVVSVMEVEDDAIRKKVANGEGVSFQVSPNQAISYLDKEGRGAFTQCGKSGKLYVSLGVIGGTLLEVTGLATEFVVDPTFDVTKVKSATPISGTDRFELVDERGAKATISKAEVALNNGQPLLTFHLRRSKLGTQEFIGRVVDTSGAGIPDVRVGAAVGSSTGSGEWPADAKTDAEGRFRLRMPLPGPAQDYHLNLVFNKDGYAGYDSREIPLPKQPGDTMDVGKFPLQVGFSLPILVVDMNEKPVSGAVVEPNSDYSLRRLAIRTDEKGRGVLRNLPAGLVRVQVTHENFNDSQQLVVSTNDTENTETKLRIKAPAVPAAANAKSPEPIAVGQIAPELAIEGWTDGKQHKLSDYRGQTVVLDFWGTWCSPCVQSIPTMQELADKYESRGVVFLAIHTPDGNLDQINKLKKVKGWKTATGVDRGTTISDGATSKSYGVRGYPSVIVIDAEGKIAFNSSIQPKDMDAFMKEMQELAESLQIPWPFPEKPSEELMLQMNKLIGAQFSKEIDKVIAAGKK